MGSYCAVCRWWIGKYGCETGMCRAPAVAYAAQRSPLEVAREALEEIRDHALNHGLKITTSIAARALHSMAAPAPTPAAAPVPAAGVRATELLAALRDQGWAVAIHNDYRLNGVPMTFWGFSRGDRFLKGEGATDIEALLIVADQADIDAAAPAVVPVETPRLRGVPATTPLQDCDEDLSLAYAAPPTPAQPPPGFGDDGPVPCCNCGEELTIRTAGAHACPDDAPPSVPPREGTPPAKDGG